MRWRERAHVPATSFFPWCIPSSSVIFCHLLARCFGGDSDPPPDARGFGAVGATGERAPAALVPLPGTDQQSAEGDQTILRPKLNIGQVTPESARIYAFLDIQQNEQVSQRIPIKENVVIVGRVDPKRGITPEIDLTQFDTANTVSRRHAQIRLEKTRFYLEDLKSTNKTRLGESTLIPHTSEQLQNGDVVSFGSVKATFRLLGTSLLPVSWSQS